MEEGTITKVGEARVGIREGTRVTFTRHPVFSDIAQDVFVGGVWVCGTLQIAGEDGGIDIA